MSAGRVRLDLVHENGSTTIDAVCWDWNGTLLDDVEVALAAMNTVLRQRGLAEMSDQEAYRAVFGFPIRAFYARLGVDAADFLTAADEYLALFAAGVGAASLQPQARATLAAIDELGVEQVLISATPEVTLERQLAPHSVHGHFAHVHGITDVYAASKEHVVTAWLEDSGHDPRRVLMVGDTNHDEEIAEALHVRFLRFGSGHQDPPLHRRHPVIDRLDEVVDRINHSPR
ncbi:phosphoglycolate phosphatase [Plantibacter flavus]|uniref:Phosphoglycolate phosphatase n=1 Tax=Plantibacter flavus TaxID=150123 RepID=A0A3N2C2J6_9MICO|nr:HAD hydrolase-like protein [Plantibacter flavus]ROR81699.1 phosphoglycolate phosphatase [Plantibacter flavus]SMG15789.1 phosphoglycolate phosphatase [Plantibacter flavus]